MSRSGAYKAPSLKFADSKRARAQRVEELNGLRRNARQARNDAKRDLTDFEEKTTDKGSSSAVSQAPAEVPHDVKLKERIARLKAWREQKLAEEQKAKARKKQPFLVPGVTRVEVPKKDPPKKDVNAVKKNVTIPSKPPVGRVTRSQAKKAVETERQWIVTANTGTRPATTKAASSFAPENFSFCAPKEIAQKSVVLAASNVDQLPSSSGTPQKPNRTPEGEDVKISPLLVNNPWITTTRGSSSRKDQERKSLANTPLQDVQSSPYLKKRAGSFANVPVNEDAARFRSRMASEGSRLTDLCNSWEELLANGEVPEEETGSVRTVIGQAQLLQRERFTQFAGLITQFEHTSGEKEITPTDLEGFWEMIYLQVSDVDRKFDDLSSLRANGWIKVEAVGPKRSKPKGGVVKKKPGAAPAARSNMRAFILAARKNQQAPAKSPGSPSMRRRSSLLMSPLMTPSKRQSLRRSVLVNSAKKPIFIVTELSPKPPGSESPVQLHERETEPKSLVKRLDLEKASEDHKFAVPEASASPCVRKTYGRSPPSARKIGFEERLSTAFDAIKSPSEPTVTGTTDSEDDDSVKSVDSPGKLSAGDEKKNEKSMNSAHTPRRSVRIKQNNNLNVNQGNDAIPGRASLLPDATISPVVPQDDLISFD